MNEIILTGKISLVTGGNRGIGKAAAIGLAQMGAQVVIVVRSAEKGETAVSDIITQSGNKQIDYLVADLGSLTAVRQLADTFNSRFAKLDILINNAGLAKREHTLTPDGYEMTFAINHLAPFLLTNLLLDKLQTSRAARIINVSSLVHKWGDIDFNDLHGHKKNYDMDKAYNQSKLANILFTKELAQRLANTNITVNSMEPGMVATDFGHEYTGFKRFMNKIWQPFMRTVEQGAETILYLAASPDVAHISGDHFAKNKPARISKAGQNMQLANQLWQTSCELTMSFQADG